MLVRFIAHAGFYVEENGYSLVIDPWFFGSTLEDPIIESVGGLHKTIDFQVPQHVEHLDQYTPDAILLSHLHTHHAPQRDVLTLLEQAMLKGKKPMIIHPTIGTALKVFDSLKDVRTIAAKDGDTFTVGPFTITAREHTVPHHIAWFVSSSTGSLLHVADSKFNTDQRVRVLDNLWRGFKQYSPTLLFLSGGGNSTTYTSKEGIRDIYEAGILTPIEAAKVAAVLNPRNASIIGCFNHSVWRGGFEYLPPSSIVEEAFAWALAWLSPQTKNIKLFPGITFGIGEEHLVGHCDVYYKQ